MPFDDAESACPVLWAALSLAQFDRRPVDESDVWKRPPRTTLGAARGARRGVGVNSRRSQPTLGPTPVATWLATSKLRREMSPRSDRWSAGTCGPTAPGSPCVLGSAANQQSSVPSRANGISKSPRLPRSSCLDLSARRRPMASSRPSPRTSDSGDRLLSARGRPRHIDSRMRGNRFRRLASAAAREPHHSAEPSRLAGRSGRGPSMATPNCRRRDPSSPLRKPATPPVSPPVSPGQSATSRPSICRARRGARRRGRPDEKIARPGARADRGLFRRRLHFGNELLRPRGWSKTCMDLQQGLARPRKWMYEDIPCKSRASRRGFRRRLSLSPIAAEIRARRRGRAISGAPTG